jgi:hypothetical protein
MLDIYERTVSRNVSETSPNFNRKQNFDMKWFLRESKVKVKLSLCFLTEHHVMKVCWGCGGIAPFIL